MDCRQVRDRLGFYIDAEIDEGSLEQIEAHLRTCEGCRQELASLRLLIESAGEIEAAAPPAGLKQQIFQAVRRTESKAGACERVSGLLSAYIDGELASSESGFVANHLAVCADCTRELGELRTLTNTSASIPTLEPPASLRGRIVAATTARPTATLADMLRAFLSPATFRWAGGAVAAGAIVAATVIGLQPAIEPAHRASTHIMAPTRAAIPAAPSTPEPTRIAKAPASEPAAEIVPYTETVRVRSHRSTPRFKIVAAVPTPKAKPNIKPGKPASSSKPVPNDQIADENLPSDNSTEAKPAEVASAPEPAPEIRDTTPREERPALTKVASAPALKKDDTEEWLKQVKAQVAMRRAAKASEGFSVINARF